MQLRAKTLAFAENSRARNLCKSKVPCSALERHALSKSVLSMRGVCQNSLCVCRVGEGMFGFGKRSCRK